MLKSYEELRKIDVTPYCDTRKAKDENDKEIDVKYLNWAKCKDLLHENGASKVYFTPVTNANGSSLIMSDVAFEDKYNKVNRCYEVRVHVVIDDLEFDMQTPLLNGTAVVNDATLNQLRVANAQARAFVKGVAIYTGLGFGLWSEYEAKEEEREGRGQKQVRFEDLLDIKEDLQNLYTMKLRNGMSQQELFEKLGVSFDTIRGYFSYFDTLLKFAKDLAKL